MLACARANESTSTRVIKLLPALKLHRIGIACKLQGNTSRRGESKIVAELVRGGRYIETRPRLCRRVFNSRRRVEHLHGPRKEEHS